MFLKIERNAKLLNAKSIFFISFYTLLIKGILVLSIRVGRIEILIWDPKFLGNIWSARNSNTFELCLSVRPSVHPSVRSNHDYVRTQSDTNFRLCIQASINDGPVRFENALYRLTGSGTSHINQFTPHLIFRLVNSNDTTKNYPHRSTGYGTSHTSQIGKLGSWAHERPIHTKFDI